MIGNIKNYSTILSSHPTEEGEEWILIPGFGNKYLVSNFGRVWSNCQCRFLKEFLIQAGYVRINLTIGGKCRAHLLHRIVASAFIPNSENKPEVNHKDGNKQNNRADNLEWNTSSENKIHARSIGCLSLGTGRPDAKLTEIDIVGILHNRYITKLTEPQLAEKYNVSRATIRNIIHGKTWKHVDCPERELINSFTRISEKGKSKPR